MGAMQRLLETMRTLRAPDGCPWDREQTHESLRPYLMEEAAEATDAIGTGDPRQIVDELGDVLLQIAFHAVIGEEAGTFGYDDVEGAIVEKLVRRHPHVFADGSASDAVAVVRNWQAIKAAERRDAAAAAGAGTTAAADAAAEAGERVPRSLPALRRAAELDKALGWDVDAHLAALPVGEIAADPAAIAEALLYLAQRARRAGIDPELALRDHLEARRAAGGA
jgi:MazG family protein